jgi:hypothetical protein
MINPQSAYLRQLLLNAGGLIGNPDVTGSTTPWPCFLSAMPDGTGIPTEAVCIYDTIGQKDGRIQSSGEVIVHYGCQIRVRAITFLNAWAEMDKLRSFIDGVGVGGPVTATYNGHTATFYNITRPHAPFDMGLEPNQPKLRRNIVLNVLMSATEV